MLGLKNYIALTFLGRQPTLGNMDKIHLLSLKFGRYVTNTVKDEA